jgi:hypothetical protein
MWPVAILNTQWLNCSAIAVGREGVYYSIFIYSIIAQKLFLLSISLRGGYRKGREETSQHPVVVREDLQISTMTLIV